MRFLVTGAAGFIGFHVSRRLLEQGHQVVGFDGMTPYYDVSLKEARRAQLLEKSGFSFVTGMLEDRSLLERTVADAAPDIVIHLAAQAGVRYALEAPDTYIQGNVIGTYNLLDILKSAPPQHLLFASTSSVYGGNREKPSRETDRTDFPVSLYAATKKSGEALCHSYAHIYGMPITALRFFTVYGPWGRPDMALFKFVRAMLADEPIPIFGQGKMRRDFTYIDDLVDAIVGLVDQVPGATPASPADSLSPVAPYRCVNLGGGAPVPLMDYVEAIEAALGMTAKKEFLPMQPGDVVDTNASPELLDALVHFTPQVRIREGVKSFVDWYRGYMR